MDETPVLADDGATSSKWRQWFERLDDGQQNGLRKKATDAGSCWNDIAKAVPLSMDEAELMKSCDSPEKLHDHSKQLIEKHKVRRRQAVQKYVFNFTSVIDQYSPVVDALTELVPYGAGKAVWGAFSVLITIVVKKGQLEAQFELTLNHLRAALPRIEAYRELYPTERMYRCIAHLHEEISAFVLKTIQYYKDLGWKGSWKRIAGSAVGYQEDVAENLLRIDEASKDVTDEGTMGMSAEIREIRQIVEGTRQQMQRTSNRVENLSLVVDRMDEKQLTKQLMVLKHKLVPIEYDSHELLSQFSKLGRQPRTGPQEECCNRLLAGEVNQWLTSPILFNSQCEPSENDPTRAKLMMLYSSDCNDDSITFIPQHIIDSASQDSRLLIYSFQHSPALISDSLKEARMSRSPKSIIKEAIYQLLTSHPKLVQDSCIDGAIAKLDSKSSLSDLACCLAVILAAVLKPDPKAIPVENNPTEILWIIDRVDECYLGVQERLHKFVKELQKLALKCSGRLRILLVSMHEPHRLDKYWSSAEIWRIDAQDDSEIQMAKSIYCEVAYEARSRRNG